MTAREIEKQLIKAGWYEVRIKGGHKHFKHKDHEEIITVPQHKGDVKKWTAEGILKTAGLK